MICASGMFKKAQIAACVQGLTDLDRLRLLNITDEIGEIETNYEEELLILIKGFYEHIPRKCNRYGIIWEPSPHLSDLDLRSMEPYICDFETMAAYSGCTQYVRHFIQKSKSYISPYHRGLLVLFAAGGIRDTRSTRLLALISWLGSTGADVLTNHVLGGRVFTPVREILREIMEPLDIEDDNSVKQAAAALRIFLPVLRDSSHQCLLMVASDALWNSYARSWWSMERSEGKAGDVLVQMSLSKLCLLTIKCLERNVSLGPQWR